MPVPNVKRSIRCTCYQAYLVVMLVATNIGLVAVFNIMPMGSTNLIFADNFDKGHKLTTVKHYILAAS